MFFVSNLFILSISSIVVTSTSIKFLFCNFLILFTLDIGPLSNDPLIVLFLYDLETIHLLILIFFGLFFFNSLKTLGLGSINTPVQL
jgi:hypothetical protein